MNPSLDDGILYTKDIRRHLTTFRAPWVNMAHTTEAIPKSGPGRLTSRGAGLDALLSLSHYKYGVTTDQSAPPLPASLLPPAMLSLWCPVFASRPAWD